MNQSHPDIIQATYIHDYIHYCLGDMSYAFVRCYNKHRARGNGLEHGAERKSRRVGDLPRIGSRLQGSTQDQPVENAKRSSTFLQDCSTGAFHPAKADYTTTHEAEMVIGGSQRIPQHFRSILPAKAPPICIALAEWNRIPIQSHSSARAEKRRPIRLRYQSPSKRGQTGQTFFFSLLCFFFASLPP